MARESKTRAEAWSYGTPYSDVPRGGTCRSAQLKHTRGNNMKLSSFAGSVRKLALISAIGLTLALALTTVCAAGGPAQQQPAPAAADAV